MDIQSKPVFKKSYIYIVSAFAIALWGMSNIYYRY